MIHIFHLYLFIDFFFQVQLENGGEHYGKLEIYHEDSWWAVNPEGVSGKDTGKIIIKSLQVDRFTVCSIFSNFPTIYENTST